MTELPFSAKLPVHHLTACFDRVTNSYKFYWFLAILADIRENDSRFISVDHLLARMVSGVWYPTNYFYLSFGKQDRLGQIALALKEKSSLALDAGYSEVEQMVLEYLSANSALNREIASLGRFVPYRFLRPFFANELRGEKDHKVNNRIEALAESGVTDAGNLCLYRFVNSPAAGIEIQADWFEYLKQHMAILMGFCLWHLLNYLQKNNPNVPNIAGKLFEPHHRNLKQARDFWRLAFDRLGTIRCIYSGQMMHSNNFSLDHFLPWRFVTHDSLWNIVPTPHQVNAAKSDNLPDTQRYFDDFARLQFEAFHIVAADPRKGKLLEDYTLLFRKDDLAGVKSLPLVDFQQTLRDTIAPQIQIAKNMGFTADWSYATR